MNERPKAPAEQPAPQTAAGQPSPQQPPQAEAPAQVGFPPEVHRAIRGMGMDLSRLTGGQIAAALRNLATVIEQFWPGPPNQSAR